MATKISTDHIKRRVLPSLVIMLARNDRVPQIGSRLRRHLGRRGRVELYFAFDDPNSAVAVIDLAVRLEEFDVQLVLRPVVKRGIKDDPAVENKRIHAINDARRLFKRSDLTMKRSDPIRPEATAFLARWVAAAPAGPALTAFCVVALKKLWLDEGTEIIPEAFAEIWKQNFGTSPPDSGEEAVRSNEKAMKRRGPYDTPAAWVHGQWFFAHDRLPQIADRLEDLGWRDAS
ncbi:MAG: hypothetical protein WBW62_10135 [Solirubrobacterales bacterium]